MSDRDAVVDVEQSRPGERLDNFLRAKFPAVSRGTLQRLIASGCIRVDGVIVKPSHSPRAGERVQIHWPEAKPARAQPEVMPLDILFEDQDILVLNKPSGLVVHPASGNEEHTLVNGLLHHCKGELSGIGGVARPGIVHRLDKDTSGCMVVAKNDEAHVGLSRQFAERHVRKVYLAMVCGSLKPEKGDIRVSIARHPSHRKRMAATSGLGREAFTTFRVLERLFGATLVEAVLHTGRTHQVRVHFQHLGHPLVGDLTYGRRQNSHLTELTQLEPPRVMLHARRLGFKHPRSSKELLFEAPPPGDWNETLAALRQPIGRKTEPQV